MRQHLTDRTVVAVSPRESQVTSGLVSVVGLGYVGLPLAFRLEERGYRVLGIDTDAEKISTLRSKVAPQLTPEEQAQLARSAVRLFQNPEHVYLRRAAVVIVCVPTPVDEAHMPDLGPLTRAIESIGTYLSPGQLIIVESTVNPGVCDEVLLPILESRSGLSAGTDFFFAHCPERINPGDAKWTVATIPRVVGAGDPESLVRARTFYESVIDAEIFPMASLKEAEAVKIVENSFRDINIAFVNELAMSFHRLGIDVMRVIEGAATKPFSFIPHTPGCGVGGHCIPVDPILRALNYEAVTYILPVLSAEVGTFYYLSENEIVRMVDSGRWEVGSHGYHIHEFIETAEDGSEGAALTNRMWHAEHGELETLSEYRARVRNDLVDSRSRLEEFLDSPIETFAFPFGEFGQLPSNAAEAYDHIMDVVSDTYEIAFYQWWPGEGYTYNYPSEEVLMRRIGVEPTWSGEDLLAFLQEGLPKELPYDDTLDRNRGWRTTWGDFFIENGGLTVAAAPDSSGASVLLDGTGHWEDYRVEMVLTSPARTGVSVYVRFRDNENTAVCNFGNGFVHVEQTVEGAHRVIQGTRDRSIVIPEGPFPITISVAGRTLTCTLDGGISVTSTFLDRSLDRGGVGIKVWDPKLGESGIVLDTLSVSPASAP